ncbi:MAG: RNA recognition motif domain-containing protein [Bacteroidia bacterium]
MITKLSYDTTDHELRNLFEGYDNVSLVKIIKDDATGRSKGFGFVEMPDENEGLSAIQNLNGSPLNGETIRVERAEDPNGGSKRESGGGGGGGYGGGGRY